MSLLFINQVKSPGGTLDQVASEVRRIAAAIGTDADALMTVMLFESGLNPAAKNPYGSASGLIQFTDSTAQSLGTTTAALRSMTTLQQLAYVERYLKQYRGKISTLENLYLSIFYPRYLGQPANTVIPLSSAWVNANKVLDVNGDGKITVGEVGERIRSWQAYNAKKLGYIIGGGAVALLVVAVAFIILR